MVNTHSGDLCGAYEVSPIKDMYAAIRMPGPSHTEQGIQRLNIRYRKYHLNPPHVWSRGATAFGETTEHVQANVQPEAAGRRPPAGSYRC